MWPHSEIQCAVHGQAGKVACSISRSASGRQRFRRQRISILPLRTPLAMARIGIGTVIQTLAGMSTSRS
jgi:hypothetical protein